MAFVYDQNLQDEEEKQQGNAPEPSNAPPTGPSLNGQAGAGAGGSSPKPPGAPSSRQFVPLQSYLDAGKGQDFGKSVAGKVDENTNTAKQQTQGAVEGFGQKVSAGTTRYDKDLVEGALADPSGFVTNRPASDYEKFGQQRTATYKGPESWSESQDFARAASSADRAFRQGEATKTEGGRMALLDEFFARPTYNRGEKSLDNLLLQADPENQAALASSAQNAQNLPSEFNTAADSAGRMITEGRGATVDAAKQTQAALAAKKASAAKEVEDRLAGLVSQRDSASKAYDDWVNQYKASQGGLYAADPNGFRTVNNATAAETATAEQRAQLAALAKLADEQNPYETDKPSVDSLYSEDRTGLQKAVGENRGKYNTAAQTLAGTVAKSQERLGNLQRQLEIATSPEAADEYRGEIARLQQTVSQAQRDYGLLSQQYQVATPKPLSQWDY